MKIRFLWAVIIATLLASVAQAADCEKALFGWTGSNGTRIHGVLANEGVTPKNPRGYQNNPQDRGNFSAKTGENCGGTAYGLACRSYPGIDMKTVTKARAVKIYHDDQWTYLRGDEFKSQYLAYKVFDLMINMGAKTAVKLLQITVNDLKAGKFPVDGQVTPDLVRCINRFTEPQTLADGSQSHWRRWCFFEKLKGMALMRYGSIIAANPNLRYFWDTWRYRAEYDR